MDYKKEYEEKLSKAITLHKLAVETNNDNTRMALEELYPELKESEDDRMRKMAIKAVNSPEAQSCIKSWGVEPKDVIAWLEKQGSKEENLKEHNICDTCEESNGCVTPCCAKLLEKQDEQKPVDKVEPKFKVGDTIVEKDLDECGWGTIVNIKDGKYIFDDGCFIRIKEQERWQLVEQKSDGEVEPKFRVGDWIIHNKNIELANSLMLVAGKHNNEYLCKHIDGQCSYNIEFIDKDYHLWTIQDAKDGDVLLSQSTPEGDKECPFIFKEIDKNGIVRFYAALLQSKNIKIADEITNVMGYANAGYHIPATKEQCELLFQKMHEAGYEWDAEKKQLKKIEQNPAWSKEDEKYFNVIYKELESYIAIKGYYTPLSCADLSWLKSLKDRVQSQPKQEWSEEDESMLQNILECLKNGWSKLPTDILKYESWLKSLKPKHLPVLSKDALYQAKKDAYNTALDKIEYHSGEPTFDDGWSAAVDYITKHNIVTLN